MFDPENNGFLFCKFSPVNLLRKTLLPRRRELGALDSCVRHGRAGMRSDRMS